MKNDIECVKKKLPNFHSQHLSEYCANSFPNILVKIIEIIFLLITNIEQLENNGMVINMIYD